MDMGRNGYIVFLLVRYFFNFFFEVTVGNTVGACGVIVFI